MNFQLRDIELKLLNFIKIQGGIANNNIIFEFFQKETPLSLVHWKNSEDKEPAWKYEVRRSLLLLKELDLITGSEFSEWHITKLGENYINTDDQSSSYNKRSLQVGFRLVRDSKIVIELKELYNYKCQICGLQIKINANSYYIEVHHLKPLGFPHNGPDEKSNLIVLCPNHHICFDYATMAINPDTNEIESFLDSQNSITKLDQLLHSINPIYINYHYNLYLQNLLK